MYGMCNACNVCMTHAMGDIISGIGIGIAVANSIRYRAPARSNPTFKRLVKTSFQTPLHLQTFIERYKNCYYCFYICLQMFRCNKVYRLL